MHVDRGDLEGSAVISAVIPVVVLQQGWSRRKGQSDDGRCETLWPSAV